MHVKGIITLEQQLLQKTEKKYLKFVLYLLIA